ncbi:MAG: aminotransferase class III-fold pyridoxal phosphate-dependent enzyme [Dehalococcoidales bacterium]|nr:aminotransferase class III-fold pyridoxal phosphate-dependent enzyme [Dehalococcoidales bacterium]
MANIVEEYIRTHPGSQNLHERAKKSFTVNGATHANRLLDPFRPYVTHAKGSRKWDVDGNEYIDYVMGHGALILGHCHPVIVQAVQEQMAKGVHYGENHELEIEWAELIKSMMPSIERVEFCACGQEANMLAVRLARMFTGRRKILRFVEGFHGWADELVDPKSPGIVADEVTIIPGHDLNLVEKELATKEYAIVITEGGGAHMAGQIPWEADFIRALPDVAHKYGTVWHLDEVVTGFRDSPGGWQATVGVTPDTTALGKCVTGGLTGGAVGGRADIFDVLKPQAPPQPSHRRSGTWNANPLTAAAGVAACKLYKDGEVHKKVNQLGAYLREKGNRVLKERGINGRLYGRSIVHFYLGPVDYEPADDTMPPTKDVSKLVAGASTKSRLCLHLLHRGVATLGGRMFILSTAHTEEDIDQTVKALSDSLIAMIEEGTLTKG